jgi:hypothetical protein
MEHRVLAQPIAQITPLSRRCSRKRSASRTSSSASRFCDKHHSSLTALKGAAPAIPPVLYRALRDFRVSMQGSISLLDRNSLQKSFASRFPVAKYRAQWIAGG